MNYESLATELYLLDRSSSLQGEGHAYSSLAKDIDLAGAIVGIIGTDSKERLHRLVGEGRNLGVDPITSELQNQQCGSENSYRCAYIVKQEEFGGNSSGEIILNASLLAANEMRHGAGCVRVGQSSRLLVKTFGATRPGVHRNMTVCNAAVM